MKTLLTLLLLTISISAIAQRTEPEINIDSAIARRNRDAHLAMSPNANLSDSARLNMIQLNLYRFSRTYSNGTSLVALGIGFEGIGIATSLNGNNDDPVVPTATIIGGAVLITVGWIIQVTAHHFIRKASGVK